MLAAIFVGLLLIVPSATAAASRPGKIACNGSSKLCDRQLNEVVLPGSHNSMSAKELDWFNPNQTYSMPNQLKHGVRAMLFDTHYGNPQPNGQVFNLSKTAGHAAGAQIYLCHESCQFGASELIPELAQIAGFLKAHPNEVLVFVNQDDVTPGDLAEAVKQSGLLKSVYTGPTGPWPTLGEMVAGNQKVVMLAEQDAEGIPWYRSAYDGAVRETPYEFLLDPALLTAADQLNESCRPNRGETEAGEDSLFLMNHWISQSGSSFEPLIEWAQVVNQKDALVNRARACEQRRGFLPNILAVDFFGTGDVVGAANELNGVKAQASLRSSRLKPIRVRAGRRAVVTVPVKNTGDAPARSVKVCATLPVRLAPRPACVRLGQVLAGGRTVARLRLKIRKGAKGSGAVKVKIRSSTHPVNLKARIKVKSAHKARHK